MVKVWGRRSSSNVQKVLWALKECDVEFERETVGGNFGGTDTKEYRKLNPLGLVPALEDGTLKLFESNAIVKYIARRYGRNLILPRGRRAFALADQWMDWSATTLNGPNGVIFMNKVRIPADQYNAEAVKQAEKQAGDLWKIVNRALGKKPFITGRHFNYADIPLGILYYRYKNLDVKAPKLPNLDRWYEDLQQRPAYKEIVMVPIGKNLEEWNANEAKLR